MRTLWALLQEIFTEWLNDRAPRLGAALAYYTVFSLAPLLLIIIAIAGLVFGEAAAQGQIVERIEGVVGADGARALQTMLAHARQPASGLLATLLGVAMLSSPPRVWWSSSRMRSISSSPRQRGRGSA